MRLLLLVLWQWFRELGQPQAEPEDDREGFYERNADKFGLPQHGDEEGNQQSDVRTGKRTSPAKAQAARTNG